MNKTEVEEIRKRTAESCMAGHHYERTRNMRAFSMPCVGDEGVVRRTGNQHGNTYRFTDGSRLWINDRKGTMKYAPPNSEYEAVRVLWTYKLTQEPQGNE